MMKTKLFFLLLTSSLCQFTLSQNYKNMQFEHITVKDGINSEYITSITQDRTGFLWFGTGNGITKYNGVDFINYTHNPEDKTSICHRNVWEICCDSKNNVWIATNEGLSRYDRENDAFISYYNFGEKRNVTHSMYVFSDSKDNVWVGLKDGLFMATSENALNKDSFTEIRWLNSKGKYMSFEKVNNIMDLGNSNYLINVKGQLKNFNMENSSLTPIEVSHNNVKLNVQVVSKLGKDEIAIGTNRGAYTGKIIGKEYIVERVFKTNTHIPLLNNNVKAIAADKEGGLWITTANGVTVIKGNKFYHATNNYNKPSSIASNIVKSVFIDEGGITWLGTNGFGLDKFDPNRIKFNSIEFIDNERKSKQILSVNRIIEDSYGLNWIETNSGLFYYNDSTGVYIKFNVEGVLRNVNGCIETKPGELWLYGSSLQRIIYALDENLEPNILRIDNYTSADVGINNFTYFYNAVYSNANNVLWLGSRKRGVIKVILKNIYEDFPEFIAINPECEDGTTISPGQLTDMELDANSNLWVATLGFGVYQVDPNGKKVLSHIKNKAGDQKSLSHNGVNTLFYTNNNLWVGTADGGLNCISIKDNSITRYSEANGLPSRNITSIASDSKDNLWIATGGGISNFRIADSSFINYGIDDGISCYSFNRMSTVNTRSGKIYFGNLRGITAFIPDNVETANTYIPTVAFTELIVNNTTVRPKDKTKILTKSIELTEKIKLNHKHNDFKIQFSAFSFSLPEKNHFMYKLEGYDDNWIETTANSAYAYYSNLPRGSYTLIVKASNSSLVWGDNEAKIEVKIRPPWWKTYLFYFIVIVLISSIIILLVKVREKQLKEDREKLQEELAEGKDEIKKQLQKVSKQEEELRIRDENEQKMKWHNNGFIQLSNLISNNRQDLTKLSHTLIFELVEYLDIEQGAIYILSDECNKPESCLELKGGYALDDKRLENKKIYIGEGLVGTCFKKSEVIQLNGLPSGYASLDSGLGSIPIKNVTLIPVIYEDYTEGVIELLSTEIIEQFKIKFVETISKNLATTIINMKSNIKISQMLEETQLQKEQLLEHEEELRQNIEELAAKQEEMERRSAHSDKE